jgi:hypothetical protein
MQNNCEPTVVLEFYCLFFRTSWGVGIPNSAILNSFHNWVEFGTILEGLRNFGGGVWTPQTPLGTPLFVVSFLSYPRARQLCRIESPHPLRHPVIAAMLRDMINVIRSICYNLRHIWSSFLPSGLPLKLLCAFLFSPMLVSYDNAGVPTFAVEWLTPHRSHGSCGMRRSAGWLVPEVWRQRNGLILNGLNIQDLKYTAEKILKPRAVFHY